MQIVVNLKKNPEDIIADFGVGAKLYWARDNSSATGAFTDASGSMPIVVGQTQYEITDTTGASGHYYRTRNGDSTAVRFDEWARVFQAGAPTAYADLMDLREEVGLPDDSRDNLLTDLLERASRRIDREVGHDFLRHPALSGTEVRTFDAYGRSRLHVPAGIISLTTVEHAPYTGGSYATLSASDWVLAPTDKLASEPYTQLLVSDVGSYPYWYSGYATVQLTGVFGWPEVPGMVEKATLDLAREWYRQGPGGGGPVGINQFGTPTIFSGLPESVRAVIASYGPALVA